MFINPLNRKYQTGGSVSDKDKTGVKKFINGLKATKEQFKDKSVDEIAQTVLDMSETGEGSKSIKKGKKEFEDSEKNTTTQSMFAKKGGKMNQFICKHGHGGINCGCGGGKNILRGQRGQIVPTFTDSLKVGAYTIYPEYEEVMPDGTKVRSKIGHDNNGQYVKQTVGPDNRITTLGGYINNGYWIPEGDASYGEGSDAYKAFMQAAANVSRRKDNPQNKQEGGNLQNYIPSMTYKRIGDVYGEANNVGSGIMQTKIGDNVEIDGRPTFIPNRVASATSMGGKDVNDNSILYPGYGYNSVGMIVYTPEEITAREGSNLRNKARRQNEPGLIRSDKKGGCVVKGQSGLSRKQVRADKKEVKKNLRPVGPYSTEDVYESIINSTRKFDQYQGMSRLERKNAINQYLLGNIPALVYTPMVGDDESEITTDVEKNNSNANTSVDTNTNANTNTSTDNKNTFVYAAPSQTDNTPELPPANVYDNMTFSKAFAAARNAGLKNFIWRGKSYGTNVKVVSNNENESSSDDNTYSGGDINPATVVAEKTSSSNNEPTPQSYYFTYDEAKKAVDTFVNGNLKTRQKMGFNLRKYNPELGELNYNGKKSNVAFADAIAKITKQ